MVPSWRTYKDAESELPLAASGVGMLIRYEAHGVIRSTIWPPQSGGPAECLKKQLANSWGGQGRVCTESFH